jgi:hypothetical protein
MQFLLPQHVSGTNMPIIRSTISEYLPLLGGHTWKAAWVVHALSHLVGSLPFTVSTMHGHMNIIFKIICFVWIVAGSSLVVTPRGARNAALSPCERSCHPRPAREDTKTNRCVSTELH